jgi:hypothetical protein
MATCCRKDDGSDRRIELMVSARELQSRKAEAAKFFGILAAPENNSLFKG